MLDSHNNRNLFSSNSGDWKIQIQCLFMFSFLGGFSSWVIDDLLIGVYTHGLF